MKDQIQANEDNNKLFMEGIEEEEEKKKKKKEEIVESTELEYFTD